jgi:hypothetical protein
LASGRLAEPEIDTPSALVNAISVDGWIYVTPGPHRGGIAIRLQARQFDATKEETDTVFEIITGIARRVDAGA